MSQTTLDASLLASFSEPHEKEIRDFVNKKLSGSRTLSPIDTPSSLLTCPLPPAPLSSLSSIRPPSPPSLPAALILSIPPQKKALDTATEIAQSLFSNLNTAASISSNLNKISGLLEKPLSSFQKEPSQD